MNEFFNSKKPYNIARGITSGHELADDLVSHAYLIICKKENIKDVSGMFASICYMEWNKPNSSFNRLYRPYYTCEIVEEITADVDELWIDSEYKQFLRDYINHVPSGEDNWEWFKRQIAKFTLIGMTQQEIQDEYGLDRSYVSKTLTQFKKDVLDNYIERFGSEDIDNL